MRLEAVPAVDAATQRALLDALEQAGAIRPAGWSGYEDPWRRAALGEGVDDEGSPERAGGYALSPRSTRGATRA